MTLRYCLVLVFMAFFWMAPAQILQWADGFGSSQDAEYPYGLVSDASGNTISIGTFFHTVDFDPGPGVANITNASNHLHAYILKLDPAGNFVWAKALTGSGGNISAYSVAMDPDGNILVSGTFSGTTDFDPGPGSHNETSLGSSDDTFVLKLDPGGNFLWVRAIGSSWDDDFSYAVSVDGAGNVYHTGRQANTIDYDPGPGTSTLTGIDNVFILNLTSNGDFVWVRGLGTTGTKNIWGIKADASGNFVITGSYNASFDTDPGNGTNMITASGGGDDAFIIKFNASGIHLWGKGIGAAGGHDVGLAVTLDPVGNILVTGTFSTTSMDFDPGAGTANSSTAGGNDIFVLKLDPSGSYIWHRAMGSASLDQGTAIDTDPNGNIYTAGTFSSTVDFDPGGPIQSLTSVGNQDAFVQKLNSAGTYINAYRWGGIYNDVCKAVDVPNYSSIYSTGFFGGTVDFNPGGGVSNLVSSGSWDIFVSKVDQCYPTTGTLNATVCNTYTAPDGQVYTTSGTYTAIIENSQGCDSIITVLLTILHPPIQPATILGNTMVCAGSLNAYTTYAIPGATSYIWTLPSGWSGSSTTDTIVATAGSSGGPITLAAYNTCGLSPSRTLNVTISPIPAQPGSIAGNAAVCPGSTNTYSITSVPGATSYSWTLPAGWSGNSSTNNISANATATGGNLSVTANNICGISPAQSMPVTIVAVPAQPGAISGNVSPCAGSENTYSIDPVPGASSYTWSLPGGWSGFSTTNSIATTAGTQPGNISVTANFASCHSIPQTLAVNIAPGPGTAFSSSSNGYVATFTDLSTGATAWSWDFGDWSTSTAQNPSHTYAIPFVFNVCLIATTANGCKDTVCHYVGITGITGTQDPASFNVSVYPNPSSGLFRIETDRRMEGQVFDAQGKLVIRETYPAGESWLDLSGYAEGIYFLRLTKGASQGHFRLSKLGE